MYKSILLIPLLFAACVSTSLPPVPKHNKPSGKTYKPKGEWQIRGEKDLEPITKLGAKVSKSGNVLVVDLQGLTLNGANQKGDGGQSENQAPLFRARVPLIVKNGFVKNNKNAATFYAPNSGVEKITWLNVGEDAVATYDGAKNFSVINCEFINNKKGDKSIQLNEADGALIKGNLVYGGITGARIGKVSYSSSKDLAVCENNEFIGTDTAWNVGKVKLEVKKDNKYTNVRLPFKVTNGGQIKNADGKVEND